jgi:hypothetical protein
MVDQVKLISFLKNEHPQTVTHVLIHIDPIIAGMVLDGLPPNFRTEVVVRLIRYGESENFHVDSSVTEVVRDVMKENGFDVQFNRTPNPALTTISSSRSLFEIFSALTTRFSYHGLGAMKMLDNCEIPFLCLIEDPNACRDKIIDICRR